MGECGLRVNTLCAELGHGRLTSKFELERGYGEHMYGRRAGTGKANLSLLAVV